ncbi:MAG: molybdenum metabolism regulator [Deltaproteobacteria bacterium]|nr:molybdenum metabolism regulator [Deltaproteobacteria bacterium]
MPSRVSDPGVSLNQINKVLEKAAERVIDARGSDPNVSRKDIQQKLKTLDGEEKALVDLFYRFTDHRDPRPGARVTETDVKSTLEYAKEKLIKRLDANGDEKLNNDEIGRMSRIGKLAASIARKAEGTTAPTPPPAPAAQYGAELDAAIAKGFVSIDTKAGKISAFRVTSDFESPAPTTLVKAILDLPNPRQLESVKLGLINEWDSHDSYPKALDELVKKGPHDKLKSVVIGDFEYPDESEISWVNIGNVSSIFTTAPNLKELRVQGGGIELGKLESAKLEKLTLHTGGLPAGAVQSLADANLPKLARLEVWLGAEEYGAGGSAAMLAKLFEGTGYPKLKQLGLMNSEFSDDLAKALPSSKILKQLETLDLSMGTLTKAGALAIIENKAKFEHLKKLDLSDNFLDAETQAALKAALPGVVTIGVQDKLDPSDPDYRYVSVGE